MSTPTADTAGLVRLVLNPRAGAGRAGRRVDDLRRAADRTLPAWDLVLTEGPGHATALAAAAAADPRVATVAAVGGDGTCHEVVNGMVEGRRARRPGLAFATVPFGTGSDLQKTLEIPADLESALRVAGAGAARAADLIAVELDGPQGRVSECIVNVAGFGANGEVVRRANRMDKRLGGAITFLRSRPPSPTVPRRCTSPGRARPARNPGKERFCPCSWRTAGAAAAGWTSPPRARCMTAGPT